MPTDSDLSSSGTREIWIVVTQYGGVMLLLLLYTKEGSVCCVTSQYHKTTAHFHFCST